MAISAQDKIMYVANKLGLSTLKNMQGSTGAVYDVDTDLSGQIFSDASRHQNPGVTNLTENQFEVNEALLIETIGFYVKKSDGVDNLLPNYFVNSVIIFDLVIGNKRVMKDTPVFAAGNPYTFASVGKVSNQPGVSDPGSNTYLPRHQVYMEGAGILIPPQVQWYVDYRIYNVVTGDIITPTEDAPIGCYLFGTRVLLNFNTTI